MPCYDPDTHARPVRLEAKVHALTAMLCSLCGAVEETLQILIEDRPVLKAWWEAHKEQDRLIQELEEKRRLHGESSLSPEERGMLCDLKDVSNPRQA